MIHQEDGGLLDYFRRGHQLASLEHVMAYQNGLKAICQNSSTLRRDDSKYYSENGMTPATVFYNTITKAMAVFNQTSGDLITGDKRREKAFNEFLETNTLGAKKWIQKWSNENN